MLLKLIWQFIKYLIVQHREEQKIIFEIYQGGFKCQQDNENDLFDCNAACRSVEPNSYITRDSFRGKTLCDIEKSYELESIRYLLTSLHDSCNART